MHPVIFTIATILLVTALITIILGLVRMSRKDTRARNTLVGGYILWLLSILLSAILFVVFSL
jgi:uncharacterized membrane protein